MSILNSFIAAELCVLKMIGPQSDGYKIKTLTDKDLCCCLYILDVFWGQPIKLAQVASTLELLENQRNALLFFEIVPCHFCRASEVQT